LGPFVSRTVVSREGEGPRTLQDQLRAPRYPFTSVSAGFFETLGIPIVEGRSFTQEEISNRTPVAVISTALATKFWPKQDAIGKKIRVGSPAQSSFALELPLYLPSVEVIGVARDVYSDSMTRPDSGAVYLPSFQGGLEANLFVRTSKDPQTQVEVLTRDLQSIDINLSPVFRTMHSVMDHNGAFIVLRTVGIVFSAIGFLGLTLALVGIYSMAGYAVGRRTREIGIRMALGARKSDVRRLVLTRSLWPIAAGMMAGLFIGVTICLLLSKVFQGIIFMDIGSLAGISILIAMVAVVATYLPTRRATNLDPASALRSQ
jgi:hypothetical protein